MGDRFRCLFAVLIAGVLLARVPAVAGSSGAFSTADEAAAYLAESESVSDSELERAERLLGEAVADGGSAEHLIGLARVAQEREEWKDARRYAEQAIERDGSVAAHHVFYGTLCFASLEDAGIFSMGSIAKKGRKAFERALDIDPKNVEAMQSLCGFYLFAPGIMGGSYKKAEEYAERLIALPEGRIAGHTMLAIRHAMGKDWELAERELDKAEAVAASAEEREQVVLARVQLAERRGEPGRVIEVLEEFVEGEGGSSVTAHFFLANALRERGDYAGAVEAYERVLDLEPEAENTPFHLGECLRELGRNDEAREAYRRYLANTPDGRHAKAARKALRDLE